MRLAHYFLLMLGLGPIAGFGREILIPRSETAVDGQLLHVQPGDVLLLEAGERPFLRFKHVVGSPAAPVTIRNSGGEVIVGNRDHSFSLAIDASRYFRLTGTGVPGLRYGIHLTGTQRHGSALMVGGLSADCEVDHLQVERAGFAGIMIKTDHSAGTVMDNVLVHDTYVHDTGGEGMYIGETKIPGQLMHHLHVWNNVVARTGNEACQICNVVEDCRVEHNVFYHAGVNEDLWQDRGMQIAHSECDFSHNIVIGAHTTLLVASGGPTKRIHHNYFESTVSGPGVDMGDNTLALWPGSEIFISDNFFARIAAVQPVILYTGSKTVIHIDRNVWDTGARFLLIQPFIDLSKTVLSSENRQAQIPSPHFVNEKADDFRLADGDPYRAMGMGLLPE